MSVALAAIETSSIAQGHVVADALVKTAEVELLAAAPVSPGKFWVMIAGEVGPVRAAWTRGREVAGDTLLDQFFIPQIHEGVMPALRGAAGSVDHDALGVIETVTAAVAIVAADSAAKAADVVIRDVRLANGIGGKGVVLVSGTVGEVEAAVAAGKAEASRLGLLTRAVVIARVHPQLKARLF
jgi:microcompartment protein CcmL/EutN